MESCLVCQKSIDREHTCVLMQVDGKLWAMHAHCARDYKRDQRFIAEHPTHTSLIEGCPLCAKVTTLK